MSTRRISDEQIRLTGIANNATLAASGDAIVGVNNNLSASDAPDGGDNFAAGYSIGSLWQWGQRVWRCYGDGQWDELLRNPSGAADGKLLGHASGVPAWVDAPSPTLHFAQLTKNEVTSSGSVQNYNSSEQEGTACEPNLVSHRIIINQDGFYEVYIGFRFFTSSGWPASGTVFYKKNHVPEDPFTAGGGECDGNQLIMSVSTMRIVYLTDGDYISLSTSVTGTASLSLINLIVRKL